jgi:hypothetical protein
LLLATFAFKHTPSPFSVARPPLAFFSQGSIIQVHGFSIFAPFVITPNLGVIGVRIIHVNQSPAFVVSPIIAHGRSL